MSTVFVLLFFACLVGVFRPIKGLKRWHFGVGAFVSFILVGITAPEPDTSKAGNPPNTAALLSPTEAAALEKKNAAQIDSLKREVAELPASDIDANLRIYQRLSELAPANSGFAEKVTTYRAKHAARARYEEHPEEALEITTFDWTKGGFGSIMMIDRLVVRNDAPFPIKDFVVKCIHQGPSGTDMDSNTRKVYEIVPAGDTKTVRNINMGFIHSQATTSHCEITRAVAA